MRRALFLLLALVLAGCASPAAPQADAERPDWSVTDVDGRVHSRDAPPGDATVLFFMATWCSSCRQTAPVLAAAHAEHAERGVRFYSIDFDPSETAEQLRAWQERHAQPWPHAVDPDLSLQRTFGVTSQSSVVLLDGDGRVVESWGYGRVTGAALDEALDRALAS